MTKSAGNPEATKVLDAWSASWKRLLIPSHLMNRSTVRQVHDDGAKLVYVNLLMGKQSAEVRLVPFNGNNTSHVLDPRVGNLWYCTWDEYSLPKGMNVPAPVSQLYGTGRVQKCSTCKGQGRVRCTSCGGRIRWTERRGDEICEKICSCGDGKERCIICDGYGEMETALYVTKSYPILNAKRSKYAGEVPQHLINAASGKEVFQATVDFPLRGLNQLVSDQMDAREYERMLQNLIDQLHAMADKSLTAQGLDSRVVFEQMSQLAKDSPNPLLVNKPYLDEILPLRIQLRVEDAPVTQVDYTFKEKEYSIWLYGSANSVWFKSIPRVVTGKLVTVMLLMTGALGGLIAWLATR